MNYRLIRSARSSRGKLALAFAAAFMGAVVLFQAVFPGFLGGTAMKATRPIWRLEQALLGVAGKIPAFFRSRASLQAEVAGLRAQLDMKEVALLDRDALDEENMKLKEEFGRAPAGKGILAAVLALPPRSPYDTLVLDIGEEGGATEGALVRVGPVVLGKIVRVHARTSVAELYSSPGTKTPLHLSHAGAIVPIEAVGQGNGAFTFTLPKETPVAEGDAVLMPGVRMAIFGTIDSVDSTVTGSFQTAHFQSPVPLSSLRFVEVDRAPQ